MDTTDSQHTSYSTGTVAPEFGSLASLLQPTSRAHFFSTHWRCQPLLLHGETPGRFDALFRIDDLDRMLATAAAHADDWTFFMARDEAEARTHVGPGGEVRLQQALALYRAGHTLRLNNLQRHHARIEGLCRNVALDLRSPVHSVGWLSHHNPHAEAVDYLHYDTPDIFVLQIHGQRHWKVYNVNPSDYSPRRPDPEVDRRDYGEPCLDAVLQPGDLLYVPAGAAHDVSAAAPDSLHITLEVRTLAWRDVLDAALDELDVRGSALAHAVPPSSIGTSEEQCSGLQDGLRASLQAALGSMPPATLATAVEARLMRQLPAPADGHFFRQVLCTTELLPNTRLQRRHGALAVVRTDVRCETASITFAGGGAMQGPGALAPLLHAVARAEGGFDATDLPGDYDLDSRLMVLNELLHLGLLERAG